MEHCGAEMKHCVCKIEHCDFTSEHFMSQWSYDVTAWVCWQIEHSYVKWSSVAVHQEL